MGRWKKKNKNKKRRGDDRDGQGQGQGQGQQKNTGYENHRLTAKNYTPAWQTNRRMEAYYAYQGLHNLSWNEESKSYEENATDEEKTKESREWMDTCKRILPASFRIGQDVDPIVRERLEQELHDLVGTEMDLALEDGSTISMAPARRVPFVPHAYQLAVDRHTIRKNKSLNGLFEWLKIQTDAGFVTRQETVSMIPPVVMDVHSHHQVLDMCAAPGSKTSQILEIVSHIPKGENEPVGCVVANDADAKRAYMLVHQLKRIQSPVSLVTSCDAQFFPLIKHFQPDQPEGMFDRVLADVPCSGDGTMRKNPGVWKKWSALNSHSLHPLQLAIALNGARLTKVGGYLCYSTCTMSPIENEAVVAELLRATAGSLELVDRREHLTDIKARPGWSTWKVLREERSHRSIKNQAKKKNARMRERKRLFEETGRKVWKEGEEGKEKVDKVDDEATTQPKDGKEEATTDKPGSQTATEDANANERSSNGDANGKPSEGDEAQPEENTGPEQPHEPLGPPPTWDEATLKARCDAEKMIEYTSFDDVEEKWQRSLRRSCFPPTEEEAKTMGLHKCLRFLPHDMDTSGFFVTLFKKVQPLSQKARDQSAELARELRGDIMDASGTEAPRTEASPAKKRAKMDPAKSKNENDDKASEEKAADTAEPPSKDADEKKEDTAEPVGKVVKGKASGRGRGAPKGNMGNENFVCTNEENLTPLIPYYGFDESLPKNQYMSRSNGNSKVIYFIGKAVKKYFDAGLQERITIINSGLKAFEKNSSECEVKYRINQEGIHYQAPYMAKRKFVIGAKDYITCLNNGAIKISAFSTELGDKFRELKVGSFMVAMEGFETDTEKKLMMVMWRCRSETVNCLVAKVERDGMRSKLRAITGEEMPEEQEVVAKSAADVAAKDVAMEEATNDEKAMEVDETATTAETKA